MRVVGSRAIETSPILEKYLMAMLNCSAICDVIGPNHAPELNLVTIIDSKAGLIGRIEAHLSPKCLVYY
jgi:hypothetical protein